MAPGTECGRVSEAAALQMGLTENTYIATSILDAHAGGLALLAAQAKAKKDFIGRLGKKNQCCIIAWFEHDNTFGCF